MIVVTMTSWVKRIGSVKKVVNSIMNNTMKPDRVYLNLSKSEFDFERVELPKDLVDYFNSDERLIINWVDGKNTKSMKKIFPILDYLDDDDIIITADDDLLFPKDFIESRLDDFNKFGKKYSITSNRSNMGFLPNMYVAAANSLYTKRMLKNWNKYVNDEIINTYNDDRTYLYILWLNGFLNKPCTKYDVKELLNLYNLNLDETSLSKSKQVIFAKKYDNVAVQRLKKITNKNINNIFGLFSESEDENSNLEEMKSIVLNGINERYSRIIKLRKDIADGKIVKVHVSDGKFVWKRIK